MSAPKPAAPSTPPPPPTTAAAPPAGPRRLTPSSDPVHVGDLDPGRQIHRRLFQYEPDSLYPTPRFAKYSRTAHWIVLPSVLFYCLFFVNFGDHEHVFSPPRRWMDRQRAKFWSLSPAELSLAQQNSARPDADASQPAPSSDTPK
ncbi:hypothetical protein BKA62DRAFT_685449 [Auriculariales sp. MPI-PUGE-AT-0066]|nr:hypothetical protein BKA62DRAFT_685449 [Auriculariales sp. MPI-PUGE-AT-0066]